MERDMNFFKVVAEKYKIVEPKEAEGDYYGYSLGLKDIEGIKPGDKDIGRMMDIVDKSSGNEKKMLDLCTRMAKSITKSDKAQRRAAAALKVLPKKVGEKAAQLFMAKF